MRRRPIARRGRVAPKRGGIKRRTRALHRSHGHPYTVPSHQHHQTLLRIGNILTILNI